MYTKSPWRYEESTRTIRSEPENYWLASMDSWDGAVDHKDNANLIAAAPDLLEALQAILSVNDRRKHPLGAPDEGISYDAAQAAAKARAAIAKANAN